MHWSPSDYAIVLVVGLLLVLVGIARSSTRRKPAGTGVTCPAEGCGHLNPPNARYCARCGRQLPPS